MNKESKIVDVDTTRPEPGFPVYLIQVYVDHGYYEYTVSSAEQATAHAQAIMSSGVYRRSIGGGMEVLPCYKVKAIGPGLESQYNDKFCRT